MDATRIVLAGCWTSLMLVYLLGDVLRLFAGDHVPGQIDGRPAGDGMWTLAALIMLVPIAMILISLLVPAEPLRWISIVVSVVMVLFNLAGLPYPGSYDNLLIVVGFAVNGIIIWQARARARAWAWDTGAA
ncbi:hypothetical protein [Allonocardiopsis opalescens]|uniref:Uncharacterized protein n=1 Tax=Allonocardiopsis opalescens TaxID=1144618 RepID=A0A2T0Q723_9ACTN|nr:hypothetical protein [Allonocardiopsis opalescens]PRX99594.1 hypothetical protein CLV72_103197 [Allonocardiopsis opalescens]